MYPDFPLVEGNTAGKRTSVRYSIFPSSLELNMEIQSDTYQNDPYDPEKHAFEIPFTVEDMVADLEG